MNSATDHYLMTRRENTIFYHEHSVEIPREEPFLCSDTQAWTDFAKVKLDLCMNNISIPGILTKIEGEKPPNTHFLRKSHFLQ